MAMQLRTLKAKIEEFSLSGSPVMDATVAIPAVRGKWFLKYGEHAYYFMDFATSRGFCVTLSHWDVIRAGWSRFRRPASNKGKPASILRFLSPRYHYGFSLLEQLMLMTVPHTVTPMGENRFAINLWSWFGFIVVDCAAKTATYHLLDEEDEDSVLGSQQWYDPQTDRSFAMSYSLDDSLSRIDDPKRPVRFELFKHQLGADTKESVWSGELSDYVHDILINETRQYCVVCELGMYLDEKQETIPSKVLILDLVHHREWVLERFIVAAHACFDPENPNIIYFSNHNFEFQHSGLLQLMKKGSYAVKFRGPAAIFKYELTEDGPRELGVFSMEDFLRLTNMHVFMHRGRNMIAAMGFPDEVFLIDAEDMSFIRKIWVKDPVSLKHNYSKKRSLIGTIAPSPDGEKLFVQTTGSFQVIDIRTGESEYVRDYYFKHTCFNHMVAIAKTTSEPGA
jgi:hypothetical protein